MISLEMAQKWVLKTINVNKTNHVDTYRQNVVLANYGLFFFPLLTRTKVKTQLSIFWVKESGYRHSTFDLKKSFWGCTLIWPVVGRRSFPLHQRWQTPRPSSGTSDRAVFLLHDWATPTSWWPWPLQVTFTSVPAAISGDKMETYLLRVGNWHSDR